MLRRLTRPLEPAPEAIGLKRTARLVPETHADHQPLVVIETLGPVHLKSLVDLSPRHVQRLVCDVGEQIVIVVTTRSHAHSAIAPSLVHRIGRAIDNMRPRLILEALHRRV